MHAPSKVLASLRKVALLVAINRDRHALIPNKVSAEEDEYIIFVLEWRRNEALKIRLQKCLMGGVQLIYEEVQKTLCTFR
jgi:hypothetical protein